MASAMSHSPYSFVPITSSTLTREDSWGAQSQSGITFGSTFTSFATTLQSSWGSGASTGAFDDPSTSATSRISPTIHTGSLTHVGMTHPVQTVAADAMSVSEPSSLPSTPHIQPLRDASTSVPPAGYGAASTFVSAAHVPGVFDTSMLDTQFASSAATNPWVSQALACPCPSCIALAAQHGATLPAGFGSYGATNMDVYGQPFPGNPATSYASEPSLSLDLASGQGRLAAMARTPKGSSVIQSLLLTPDPQRYMEVFNELNPHFLPLLCDSNGVYVMKCVMDTMTDDQVRVHIIDRLNKSPDVVLRMCTESLHSRRIVQYILDRFTQYDCSCFAKVCATNTVQLATSQQGCISMQRILDKASPEQRGLAFNAMLPCALVLAAHPFGNYVVSYVLEHGGSLAADQIAVVFSGRVFQLSCDKFASNVLEKCLENSSPLARQAMVLELFQGRTPQTLQMLLQDPFGNYIVQACINVGSDADVDIISAALQPVLGNTAFGNKILARIQRRASEGQKKDTKRRGSHSQHNTAIDAGTSNVGIKA